MLINFTSEQVLLQDATILDGLHVPQLRRVQYQLEEGRVIKWLKLGFTNGEEEFETDEHGTRNPDEEVVDYRLEEPVRSYQRNMIIKNLGNGFRQFNLGFNRTVQVGSDGMWLIPTGFPGPDFEYLMMNQARPYTDEVELGENEFFCGYNVVTAESSMTGEEVFISVNFILCEKDFIREDNGSFN